MSQQLCINSANRRQTLLACGVKVKTMGYNKITKDYDFPTVMYIRMPEGLAEIDGGSHPLGLLIQ